MYFVAWASTQSKNLFTSSSALFTLMPTFSIATSDNGTLDDLLTALENSKVSEVAIKNVGISVNNDDDKVNKVLDWVLAQETKYNHEFGLLNLK